MWVVLAVVAKAPRKQLAPVHAASPSGKSKKGGKHAIGGNPAKVWPTPAWQKGIADFLSGEGEDGNPPVEASEITSTSAGQLSQPSSDSAEISSQSSSNVNPHISQATTGEEEEEEQSDSETEQHCSDDGSED